MQEQFDFIGLGDITTDAFIRLADAEVHESVNKESRQICMRFGDKIPFESVTIVAAVGNSPNASVSAARLGLRSALITNLGDDRDGEEAIQSLQDKGVNTDFVKKHPGRRTNYHYVLWYQDDRTILIKHEEYPYELPENFKKGPGPKWLYLSSLGHNSLPFHHEIAAYLREHPETKLAFQPGTFQIKLGSKELADIYQVSEIFFCNVQEAQRIIRSGGQPAPEGKTEEIIMALLTGIHRLGPEIVVITDGPFGAYAYQEGQAWFMPPYPDPKPPLERTGAGDSFSSTFTAALALGKTVPEALRWGPISSMSVVQYVGAQVGLLTREQLEKYLSEAPTDYQVRLL